jgi:hypothetical protein
MIQKSKMRKLYEMWSYKKMYQMLLLRTYHSHFADMIAVRQCNVVI